MSTYDLYGIRSGDLHHAKSLLETAFLVSFGGRESSYQGGDYYFVGDKDGENFLLKRNVDPFDGGPAETEFRQYEILLYINNTSRSADLHEKISQVPGEIALLRHEEL